MKRTFDFTLSMISLIILVLPLLLVSIAVAISSSGPILYWSQRVGKNNQLFWMPKFRTMRVNTPTLATHLLENPQQWVTPIGSILRKTSLDELPQLWSILVGNMSFVGPRPALFNQQNLIELRTHQGVHILTPGLTGWAQINGRDDLPIPQKVAFDIEYLERQSLLFDTQIIFQTFLKVVKHQGVKH